MKCTPALRRSILCMAALAMITAASAQTPSVFVYGTVKDLVTRDSIPQATLQIGEEAGTPVTLIANARGRYEFELTDEKVYLIRYDAPGKVGKSVVVDTRGPTPEQWEGGFGMNIDVVLMDNLPDVDYSILSEPFGRAGFVPASGNFEWDMEYTRSMRDRQAALLDAYRARTTAPKE